LVGWIGLVVFDGGLRMPSARVGVDARVGPIRLGVAGVVIGGVGAIRARTLAPRCGLAAAQLLKEIVEQVAHLGRVYPAADIMFY
jgi:hypothetical protein